MFKNAYFFFGSVIISMSCLAGPTSLECQSSTAFEKNLGELEKVVAKVEPETCPKPSVETIRKLCNSIASMSSPSATSPGVDYGYQEDVWNMSCAKPGVDTVDEAKPKIQKMWNENRESITCSGSITNMGNGKNVTKFSFASGFPTFLEEAVKIYKLDMNFKDPKDNGRTVMDFILERIKAEESLIPKDDDKIEEYQDIYDTLHDAGAKHSSQL